MGFSNKVNNACHYIKIKGLEKARKKHFFELDWEELSDNVFSWKLIKITPSEYEFEWTMRQTIKILFVDSASENYQLDISYNSLSRWLLNSLLWYVEWMVKYWHNKWKVDLELSLYLNKDNYKQMWININWDRANWKYSIDEQKALIETITNKKGEFVSNDYSALDETLKNWIEVISEFITINDFIDEVETKVILPKHNTNEEISIEDIPFK
jgi:hypothetical protein